MPKPFPATHCSRCRAEFIGRVFRGVEVDGHFICATCNAPQPPESPVSEETRPIRRTHLPESEFLTIGEAAEWLKLKQLGYPNPEQTLKKWAALRKIGYHFVGRNMVFTLEDLRHAIKPGKHSPCSTGERLLDRQPDHQRQANNVIGGDSVGEVVLAPGKLPDRFFKRQAKPRS